MDAPMKKGTAVRQVVKPFAGVVTEIAFDQDALQFKYRVSYTVGEESHDRWFTAAEIEEVVK